MKTTPIPQPLPGSLAKLETDALHAHVAALAQSDTGREALAAIATAIRPLTALDFENRPHALALLELAPHWPGSLRLAITDAMLTHTAREASDAQAYSRQFAHSSAARELNHCEPETP